MPYDHAVIFSFIAVAFLGLCVFSTVRERRRLRNGIYLVLGLVCLGIALLQSLSQVSREALGMVEVVVFLLMALAAVVLATFLVANGIIMIGREGGRLANLLSLLGGLGILVFIVLLFMAAVNSWYGFRVAMVSVTLLVGYFSFLFSCYLLYSTLYGRMRVRGDLDFIVLLGSGLVGASVPPLLASRLNRGRAIFDTHAAAGKTPRVITSGGQGPDEEVSEARAMADYLVAHGVPRDQIILEDQSRSTDQNLTFSKGIMEEADPSYRCVIVTNNFHAFRAALLARKIGVNGHVIGSPTARYFWPSATIREFVAILADHKLINGTVCAALVSMSTLAGFR